MIDGNDATDLSRFTEIDVAATGGCELAGSGVAAPGGCELTESGVAALTGRKRKRVAEERGRSRKGRKGVMRRKVKGDTFDELSLAVEL